jgi:hypothetical protein
MAWSMKLPKPIVPKRGRALVTLADARLTDLREFLTADCPQRARKSIDSQCQAAFDPPPETRREKPTW